MADSPISILLVEDSPLDADLCIAHLTASDLSFRIRQVDTEAEFREAIERAAPDVILSDISLPSFDGYQALALARQVCPDVPFIVVSGVMGEEVAVDTLKRGATDYVLKQRLQRLAPAVDRALKEASYRRQARQSAEALQQSEARLRLALSTARLGDWELDLATDILTLSPQCKANFGLPLDGAVDRHAIRANVHPEDRAILDERVTQAIAAGTVFESEYRVYWPDGSLHWLVASGRSIPGPDGKPSRLVGVTLDDTRRKQAADELAQQARELAALNKDLEQFAFAASHDLREPLRTISSFASLLSRRYQGKIDGEADEFLGYIVSSVRRMSDLLTDVLAYSSIPVNSRPPALVDMNAVFDATVQQCRLSISENNASLTRGPLPPVFGEAGQLSQVFQNLIGNALKYRSDVPPEIHVQAVQDGSDYVFSVRDNGIGFEPAYADHIFGLFKRLHKDHYPGTGLGLAICHRIISRHNGRIWAESEPGKGSTFYFTLPVMEQPE